MYILYSTSVFHRLFYLSLVSGYSVFQPASIQSYQMSEFHLVMHYPPFYGIHSHHHSLINQIIWESKSIWDYSDLKNLEFG